MTTLDTPAELAATRHLIGLSISELAAQLGVSTQIVRDWERGRYTPREGVLHDIAMLRARHDETLSDLSGYHEDEGGVISLPDEPMPQGWYTALGARLIDRHPDVMLEWT